MFSQGVFYLAVGVFIVSVNFESSDLSQIL